MTGFLEYIAEMGEEQRKKLRSLITNLLSHRLKIKYVGGRDVPHWQGEIKTWEPPLFRLVGNKPSLKSQGIDLSEIYADLVTGSGRFRGELRKDYPRTQFPDTCPFTLKQVVGNRVWQTIGPKQKGLPQVKR